MTTAPLFSPRILTSLGGVILVIFAISLLLSISGGEGPDTKNNAGSNSYSRSAVGHAGFYDMLQRLQKRVERSQYNTLAKVGRNGILVLAEPGTASSKELLETEIRSVKSVLLVLPKWQSVESRETTGWISSASLLQEWTPLSVLFLVVDKGEIIRVPAGKEFQTNTLGQIPAVEGTMQLVKNSKMRPLIATSEGILLGEIINNQRRILVLSDPDIIQNHAIGKGSNALLVASIIENLVSGGNNKNSGPIVFDETIHGFSSPPKVPWQLVTAFPFNLVAVQFLVAIVLLLLATTIRFGTPQTMPRALGPSKHGLIANTALLLDYGGHHTSILRRYVQTVLQDTARRLRAPRGLTQAGLMDWLDRTSQSRGQPDTATKLVQAAEAVPSFDLPRLFGAARAIYFWKKGMLNGTAKRPDDH